MAYCQMCDHRQIGTSFIRHCTQLIYVNKTSNDCELHTMQDFFRELVQLNDADDDNDDDDDDDDDDIDDRQ